MLGIQWFTDKRKAWKLRNSIVVCFNTEGCMAQSHVFVWLGQVIEIKPCETDLLKGYQEATIEIFKKKQSTYDARDGDLGFEKVVVENTLLQEIKPGLFFYLT